MSKLTESKKEVKARKAALRASLPDLLNKATASPQAAQEALRAHAALRRKPPTQLLTEENIFRALPSVEIARSLGLLSRSKDCVSLSTALTALRMKQLDKKSVIQVSKAITSNVRKIVGQKTKSKTNSTRIKEKQYVIFEEPTVADAASVILWLITELFELPDRQQRSSIGVAINLLHTLDEIWRHSGQSEAAEIIVGFFHNLRRQVKRSVYADLEDDPQIEALIRDADSALVDHAKFAVMGGRLKDLDNTLRLLADDRKRGELLSVLALLCQERASQILPETVEWVARHKGGRSNDLKAPVAADESQSSALNYVSASLLAAWDASHEGHRSQRSLESVEKLAQELFKVRLMGTPGEVVTYDERSHVTDHSNVTDAGEVEVVRPGVRWSDGIRVRVLVRAIVKPVIHEMGGNHVYKNSVDQY